MSIKKLLQKQVKNNIRKKGKAERKKGKTLPLSPLEHSTLIINLRPYTLCFMKKNWRESNRRKNLNKKIGRYIMLIKLEINYFHFSDQYS